MTNTDTPGLIMSGGTIPPTSDPIEAVRDCIVFGSRDWGQDRDLAWIYGILVGWETGDDDDFEVRGELMTRFGWDSERWGRMVALHQLLSSRAGGE